MVTRLQGYVVDLVKTERSSLNLSCWLNILIIGVHKRMISLHHTTDSYTIVEYLHKVYYAMDL